VFSEEDEEDDALNIFQADVFSPNERKRERYDS